MTAIENEQWEYLEYRPRGFRRQQRKKLAKLGEQGWELVSVTRLGHLYLFKRRKRTCSCPAGVKFHASNCPVAPGAPRAA